MKKIAIVEKDGIFQPAEPFPADAIEIRGDIDPGYYVVYERGDELPEPAEEG